MRCAVILLALFAILNTDIAVAQEDLPPLHAAVQAGDLAEVKRLLEAGADPGGYTNRGLTPLDIAISEDHPRIFAALIRAGSRTELPLLHATIREGYLAEAERLLEAGADPNELDDNGRSPLIDALAYGREELVYRLLEAGADPSVGEVRGRSPIIIAVSNGHPGVVEALLDAGVDPNSTDEDGEPVLHVAAGRESGPHTAVLWELIKAGADVEARGEYGQTPLYEAARRLNMHAMDLLLLAGASLEPEIFGIIAGGGQGSLWGSDEVEAARHSRSLYMLQRLIRVADQLDLGYTREDETEMMIGVVKSAVRGGNTYVLEEYLRPGSLKRASADVPDSMVAGLQEALRSAVGLRNEEAVRLLLDAGVPPGDINATGPPEIVALLEAARADESTETNACTDSDCFEEAFRACEESVVFSADEPRLNARVEYEIMGPVVGEGFSGCEVSMVYRENPNPAWVDQPVRLTLDPQRSFMEEIARGLQQCVEGTPGRYACDGPLLEMMRQ